LSKGKILLRRRGKGGRLEKEWLREEGANIRWVQSERSPASGEKKEER